MQSAEAKRGAAGGRGEHAREACAGTLAGAPAIRSGRRGRARRPGKLGRMPAEWQATPDRPKKKPAVMSSCAAAYAHQIGTANTSLPSTNRLAPIMASDSAKQTAPAAVHPVGSLASSAAHTMAPSTAT